ncbi:MAG TPA: hypothetical protein VIO80_10225 [Candidatus Dormibacteraeota bacterium]|jgi:hypothetical protein
MESVFGAQSPAAPPEDHPSMRFLLTCRPLSGHSAKGGVLAIRELTIDPTRNYQV